MAVAALLSVDLVESVVIVFVVLGVNCTENGIHAGSFFQIFGKSFILYTFTKTVYLFR